MGEILPSPLLFIRDMINIVSSNCFAGYYFREKGVQHQNPFIYCNIKLSSFIQLVENYDKINFENITRREIVHNFGLNHCSCVSFEIDSMFTIYFSHYLLGESGVEVSGGNVYSKNILDFAEKRWLERVKRMDRNKRPLFIYWDDIICTDGDIKALFTLANKKNIKVIVYTNRRYDKQENVKFLQMGDGAVEPKVKDFIKAIDND